MYFREKISPTAKNPILQLVESQRIGDKVRQWVILSLGTHFNLPKELRGETARVIEQKLIGQKTIWNDERCNEYAERIIKKIQTDGRWYSLREQVSAKSKYRDNAKGERLIETADQTAEVFIDQVEHKDDRELGPLLIGRQMWNILGFREILKEAGFSENQVKTAQISILNRFISGDSEHAIPSWIKTTGIEDLIDAKAEEYSEDRFYRISDKLLKKKEYIEDSIYAHTKSHFGYENSIFLYDLTNTYFEGQQQGNAKAAHNKNQKEKRSDCPQVVVAIVLDEEGFLRKHFVFEGKLTDVASLSRILSYLEEEFKAADLPTIIMDRGIASKKNINLLKSKQLHYIIASRREEEIRLAEEFSGKDFKTIKQDKNNEVKVKIIKTGDEKELLCKSSGRKRKERAMRNMREERLEQDLKQLEYSVKQGYIIKPSDVQQRIGRIKERYRGVARYYSIEYIPYTFTFTIKEKQEVSKRLINALASRKKKADQYQWSHKKTEKELEKIKSKYGREYSKVKTDLIPPVLQWGLEEEKREPRLMTDGNYVLKTNRGDLSDEQIWHTYVMLTRVEKAFRNFKSDLGLRPNYHQLEQRVDAHIFITVLAYHLLHTTEYILHGKGCNLSWKSVKRLVRSHTYSTIVLPTTKGAVIHLRKPGIPETIHRKIYRILAIDYKNLKTTKIIA